MAEPGSLTHDLPDALRRFAEFPLTYGPEPPVDAPVELIRTQAFSVLLLPGQTRQLVEALDAGDDVAGVVDEVRGLLRERGRGRAIWFVAPSCRPADLAERLLQLGLQPASGEGWEPRYASLLLDEPPEPGPAEVLVRPAASFDEFSAAAELEDDVMGVGAEEREARRAHRETLWNHLASGDAQLRIYAAYVDGTLAGVGRSLFGDVAVNLSGGAVDPAFRGRGAYRALVRVRWDDAVARGTPALTVQAGAMSRPILERLGFRLVSEQHCLLDLFDESSIT